MADMRPRQHKLETVSRGKLISASVALGWSLNAYTEDYGIDFVAHLFEKGNISKHSFFIQLKSADRSFADAVKTPSVRLATRRLEQYRSYALPVMIVLYSAPDDCMYFRWVHNLPVRQGRPSGATTTVTLPFVLDCTTASFSQVVDEIDRHAAAVDHASTTRGWRTIPRALVAGAALYDWDSASQFDRQMVPVFSTLVYELWDMRFTVLRSGDGLASMRARALNVSQEVIYELDPPIFGTSLVELMPEDLGLWATCNGSAIEVRIGQWDLRRHRGRLVVRFPKPLFPGDAVDVSWGYQMFGVWTERTEFVQWDISHQIAQFSGSVSTELPVVASSPEWASPRPGTDGITLHDDGFAWRVPFPDVGYRYRIEFNLEGVQRQ